ncbi:quinoprotein glucose dehydrogenase [Kitasatospora xanthocidica]|uniref:Quinoprotein glucose dehydrogenase n=1 Tax=Kitasatospora xanthocidica TaxID=83382 RepID=A0A372ZQP9_9ACTN|nr:glucose/sorbosone family PQQ-dependent dehydrogenase [Kitasatospora xanthocidica]RGD57894.1 quinoprotein glucose dehydrogenase [Kitasatospora xanthocidica]
MRKLPVALALIPAAALITSCSDNGGAASGGSTAAQKPAVVTAEPVQSQAPQSQAAQAPQTQVKVVTDGLGDPFELAYAPDGRLWVSEKSGLKITRVDPQSGAKSTALDLTGKAFHSQDGQDGVLGFALHPDFGKGKGSDYLYLAYTYKNGNDSATKIVRYTAKDGQLSDEQPVLTGLPGHNQHQSARIRYGQDGKLYYSIGDQGHNYMADYCLPNHAQDLPTAAQVAASDWSLYQGKVLRINPDGSVPDDNPELNGARSHIYAYGMRNPDGMDFGGKDLYTAENGPLTDDEFNLITKGGNYGWPNVAGWKDDKAYVYSNWSQAKGGCEKLTYNPDPNTPPAEVPTTKETDFTKDMVSPLSTYGTTVESGHNFGTTPVCPDAASAYMCWPTMAPGSLKVYGDDVLVTSLKNGTVFRLSKDGKKYEELFRTVNRYRDVALSPDGKTLYIATDSEGQHMVRGDGGTPTTHLANPGAILAVPYDHNTTQ